MRVLTVSALFFPLQDVSARRGRLFESSSDGWLNDKDEEDGEDEEEEEEEGGEERHENEQTARRTRGLRFERTRAKRPVRRERASERRRDQTISVPISV